MPQQAREEIRDSKVLKSKCPVFAQFWSKSDNFSFDWWTTVQILEEKYLHQIFAKNVVSIGKKPVPGVWQTSNSAHKQITLCREKNLKITFLSGARNIVKKGSEIYKYFLLFFIISKYLMFVLRPVFNSSPQFHSHPAWRALELQLTFL